MGGCRTILGRRNTKLSVSFGVESIKIKKYVTNELTYYLMQIFISILFEHSWILNESCNFLITYNFYTYKFYDVMDRTLRPVAKNLPESEILSVNHFTPVPDSPSLPYVAQHSWKFADLSYRSIFSLLASFTLDSIAL